MPLFHFHFDFGKTVVAGKEGMQFANLADAITEAENSARDVAAEIVAHGIVSELKSISITDEAGRELASVAMSDFLP